jgi:hypothetical protein
MGDEVVGRNTVLTDGTVFVSFQHRAQQVIDTLDSGLRGGIAKGSGGLKWGIRGIKYLDDKAGNVLPQGVYDQLEREVRDIQNNPGGRVVILPPEDAPGAPGGNPPADRGARPADPAPPDTAQRGTVDP